jgi:D-alanine-D-alanine ligase-like ATP-grasp enzyme
VHSRREFEFACRAVARMDQMILVERFIAGRDYRVVVLDGKIISAYERIALSIVGDGKISIRSLLTAKQKEFVRLGRDTVLKPDDCRIFGKLERQGLSFQSRPAKGRKVYLLDNANLSSGGDSEDITRRIHRGFREIAARVTADMGLRLCGVDFMIDGDICDAPKPGHYWIIEINSAPGLDHYAAIGARQRETVERLYTRVLRAMDTEV